MDACIQPSPPKHTHTRTHTHGCFMRRNIFGYSPNTRAFFFLMMGSNKTNKPLEKEKDTFRGGFPDSSVGKESGCNAGDPGSIRGSGI